MNIVLLQGQLTVQEIEQLLREFPQYLFLPLGETAARALTPEQWERLEILYGARWTKEDMTKAPQLRWIHAPQPNLKRLCLDEIEKQSNILVTYTQEEGSVQTGEFVMAGILAFAKQLFVWPEADQHPQTLWDSKWRDTIWTLRGKLHLQIGLAQVGSEIARQARHFGLRVWGVQQTRSFHPYCQKVFAFDELHAILPEADIVSLAMPRGKSMRGLLEMHELELMKKDAILILVGGSEQIDAEALAQVAATGKFRGILLDVWHQTPIPAASPLWKIPRLIITPEIAPRPKSGERTAFRTFLYNMRQYLHGNFQDMRNLRETLQKSL